MILAAANAPWRLAPRAATLLCAVALLAGCAGGTRTVGLQPQVIQGSSEPNPVPESARARSQAHLDLATSYLQAKHYQVALTEAQEAQTADPTYVAPYTLAGMAYAALNDQANAKTQYAKALAISPNDARVLHNLAWLECQDKQYAQADAHFAQALAAPNPGRATTLLARGICQARAGNDDQAIATLKESQALDAGNPATLYNLAAIQYRRGDLTGARHNIRQLNNSTQANAQSLWLGVRVEHRLGDARAQQELAAQLQRRFGDSPEALALEQGKYDE